MPPYRHSVFATSAGCPENGAASDTTLSRNGTVFFRSPPSSASTQRTVDGWSARQWELRGPGSTPVSVVPSRDGRSAIFLASSPARLQISTSCAKPLIGTRCENGFFTLLTSTNWPLGDGVTLLKMPGRPMVVFAPVPVLTAASWLVK